MEEKQTNNGPEETPVAPENRAEVGEPKKEEAPIQSNGAAQKLLFGFLIFGGVLVILFYIMVFWGTVSGSASNPLFETLGVEAGDLKNLLGTMTNAIFGVATLILLLTTLVFLFRAALLGKEAVNRKLLFTRSGVYFLAFLVVVGLWVFIYWFISSLNAGPRSSQNSALISTYPENVVGLNSPIRVEFDLTQKLYQQIDPQFIRQINWDFNADGVIDASGPKVSHRFLEKGPNNGRYLAEAEIFYTNGVGGEEKSVKAQREVIISNESVLGVIAANPETGIFPLEVELNALESKDPDGSIVLYEWDLDGDGEFEIREEEGRVNKTFDAVGEYKVQLRVTGTNNDFDIAEKIIKVKNPEGSLRAEITVDGLTEGTSPLRVKFDGSNSFVREGQITRYEWFVDGDDESYVGRKMQRVFREPGEYKVILTVQNDLGERHQTEKIISVLEEETDPLMVIKTTPPQDAGSGILRGVVPFQVTFDASRSEVQNAFEWQWDFQNDGIIDDFAQAVKHTFREPGTYEVKLTILDVDERRYTKIQKVVVERAGIRAKIAADPTAGDVPLKITFDGSGSYTDEGEIVDYIWEFPGVEPIHYGAKISYLFKTIGNFPVKLTVLTSTGKIANTEYIVSARAPQVVSDFNFAPQGGTAPLLVTFNPGTSSGLIQEYFWDFGDGQVQKQIRPVPVDHLYQEAGIYEVRLRLVDRNGLVSESIQSIEVKPPRKR